MLNIKFMAKVKVCKVSDIKEGEGKLVQANGKQIAVFKKDGKFFAIDNTCPHMGGSLCDGDIDNEEVTCPLHMWKFNIKTGENTMPGIGKIGSYKVEVQGSDLVIEA